MKNKSYFIFYILCILCIIYICFFLHVIIHQNQIIYKPTLYNQKRYDILNHTNQTIIIQSTVPLIGWYYHAHPNQKTILFLHGNADLLYRRIYKLNAFSTLKMNYLLFAYRGYHGNQGHPSEEGLYTDAMCAKQWLIHQGIREQDIILYGESLGGSVAIEVARKSHVGGMILESTFTSMKDMIHYHYPYLPIAPFISSQYTNDTKLLQLSKTKKYQIPILFIHGHNDTMVPLHMGKQLFETYHGPKHAYFKHNAGHMMLFTPDVLHVIHVFISQLSCY